MGIQTDSKFVAPGSAAGGVGVQLLGSFGDPPMGPALLLSLRELNEGGFSVEGAGSLPAGVEHAVRFSAGRKEVVVRARSLHCVRISANGDAPKFVIWFGFPRQRPEDVHRIAQVTALMEERETT